MNNFIFKKLIGDMWITLPVNIIGGDENTTTPALMKRFSGMVFDLIRAGLYNLPQSEFLLPNGDIAELSVSMATTVAIKAPIRLCVGFFMLEDEPIFNNGEFEIDTSINNQDQHYGSFKCKFTIKDNIVTDYAWQNAGPPSDPFVIRNLNFISNSNCFPVIFAVEDSDEFNSSYIIDEGNKEPLLNYDIPADWVNPIGSETVTRVKVNFTVSGIGVNDFNIPQGYLANVGSIITLPTHDAVFKNSYMPYGWLIDNIEYALGSSFTVPDHNVTANLLYNDKHYSGIVVL